MFNKVVKGGAFLLQDAQDSYIQFPTFYMLNSQIDSTISRNKTYIAPINSFNRIYYFLRFIQKFDSIRSSFLIHIIKGSGKS